MPITYGSIDPHSRERGYYECQSCGRRLQSEERPGTCAECGGRVVDLSVGRE